MKGYEDVKIDTGDLVFYQYEDKKAWLGPQRVSAIKGGYVFIFANGNIRKIPRCNMQLSKKNEEVEKHETEGNNTRVRFEEKESECLGDEIENKIQRKIVKE